MDAEYVSEYGPREGSARDKKKDKGLSYQRRLRNRQAKKVQHELDGLGLDDFDEERVAREEYNKEHDAAAQVGLPPSTLSWREKRELPATAAADPDAYVVVRNSVLCKWLKNPHEYLTRAEAIKGLRAKHAPTAKLAHDFLTRYGYINTGVFDNPRKEWNKEKVIVLGAGASGLAAAKHLHHLGYQVTVLEARDRVGGRVNTNSSLGGEIDLGAMVVTGTIGNPVFNLIKQVREEVHILESDCPLYTAAGIPPPADLDEKVEKDFNDVLRLTNKVQYWDLMREEKNTAVVFGKAAYVKEEKKLVLAPREEEQDAKKAETPRVKKEEEKEEKKGEEDSIQVPSMEEELEAEAKPDTEAQQQQQGDEAVKSEPSEQPASVEGSVAPEVKQEATTELKQETEEQKTEALASFYAELMGEDAGQPGASVKEEEPGAKGGATTTKASPPPRKRVVSLTAALSLSSSSEKITDRTSLGRAIDHVLQEQNLYPEYTPLERSTFDWHVANLEYACAAELADISLRHWDQDDQYDFEGHHCLLQRGYGTVLQKLADGLDIRYGHPVESLHYDDDGVRVTTSNGDTLEGDIVLVTLPLGVLKRGAVSFEPPLPGWKVDVINRMGFGNLNKVGLLFPSVFWDDTKDYFGVCDDEIAQRGECFIYNNMHRCMKKPILLALVAGGAAYTHEERSDEENVARAMRKLRQVYPGCPDPINHVITRWYSDPFARGSYSYVSVDASGDDYDTLARPVSLRLFFAGEATQREHPATVAGAYLSGLREAGRIDRAWSGPLEAEELVARATTGKRRSAASESKSRKSATQSLSAMPRFKKKAGSSGNGHDDRDRERDRDRYDRDDDRDRRRDRDDRDRRDRDRRDRDRDRDRDRGRDRDADYDRDRDRERDRDSDRDRDRERERRSDGWDRRENEKRKTPPRSSSPPSQQKKYRWEDAFPPSSATPVSSQSALPAPVGQLPFQPRPPLIASAPPRVMGLPTPPPYLNSGQQQSPQGIMPPALAGAYNPAFPTHLANRPPLHMTPPLHHQQLQHQQQHYPQQQMPAGLHQFAAMGGAQPFMPMPQQAAMTMAMGGLGNNPPARTNGHGGGGISTGITSGVEVPQGQGRNERKEQKERDEERRAKEKAKIPVAASAGGSKDKAVSSEKKFRKTVGTYVVKYLKKYLDGGKVKSKDDFKHLARKLTHLIVEKEQRRMLVKKASSKKGRSAELKWNEKVKDKLISFVDEYMDKLPGVYEAKSLKM